MSLARKCLGGREEEGAFLYTERATPILVVSSDYHKGKTS